MLHYVTAESFGSDLPDNWEWHAKRLNTMIDNMGASEDLNAVNEIWDTYWSVMADCETFVASLIMSSTEGREPMTEEEAAQNLREWYEEGWEDIPLSLTPEVLSVLWNDGIKERS